MLALLHERGLGSRLPGTRPEFLDFPENRQGKEQVVFSGEGQRDPKISLALEQPRLAPVQPWGCPRARDNFGTLRPSPKKTTCSFPYRFSGKSRNSGLVPGKRDPKKGLVCKCSSRGSRGVQREIRTTPFINNPSKGWMLYYLCFSPSTAIRTPSAIGSAIGRPLSRPISHPNTVVGVLSRLVLNRLGGSTAR